MQQKLVMVQRKRVPEPLPQQKIHNKSDDPVIEARLKDILALLYSFYAQEIDMSLERVERFLAQLGNPHLKLPPVIHVAGTNGKGSTIATLRSLLEASGKTAHVFTSPHLVHPSERIRLAGELITTPHLVQLLEECLAVNRDEPITFFEIFTAAAFLAMARTPADYVLLETGMGGRLDATNVVPNPICTIITTISRDHEKFLGNTLAQIAREKAGIMKAGVPCVIGYQTAEAIAGGVEQVFHEVSTGLSPVSPLLQFGSEWQSEAVSGRLKFTWQGESIMTRLPNLIGTHQIYNVGAALAAYRVIIGDAFDPSILSTNEGDNAPVNPLGIIDWPGRLQKLETGVFAQVLKPDQELWIDGGHNDSAGVFLAEQAAAWKAQDGKPLHLIVAMVNRKNPKDFLTPLTRYAQTLTLTEIAGEENSYSAEQLHDLCADIGFEEVRCQKDMQKAVQAIKAPNARILITGSLYLMGQVLKG